MAEQLGGARIQLQASVGLGLDAEEQANRTRIHVGLFVFKKTLNQALNSSNRTPRREMEHQTLVAVANNPIHSSTTNKPHKPKAGPIPQLVQ